jgi:hypothetical protein
MLKRSIELCEVIRGAILSEAQSPYCHPERSAAESKDLCVKMK